MDDVVPKSMTTRLSRLLSPSSIAFIGGAECEVAIRQTRGLDFRGEMFAVNPKRSELAGIDCVHSVDALPARTRCGFRRGQARARGRCRIGPQCPRHRRRRCLCLGVLRNRQRGSAPTGPSAGGGRRNAADGPELLRIRKLSGARGAVAGRTWRHSARQGCRHSHTVGKYRH